MFMRHASEWMSVAAWAWFACALTLLNHLHVPRGLGDHSAVTYRRLSVHVGKLAGINKVNTQATTRVSTIPRLDLRILDPRTIVSASPIQIAGNSPNIEYEGEQENQNESTSHDAMP